jgi:uncharacterized YigZ family protein
MSEVFELIRSGEAEFQERGSKFIGMAKAISAEAEAKKLIDEQRELHPKANHVCYAYRLREQNTLIENLSDDGEPTHSAGQPILKQIRSAQLENCLVMVVRYFGGVKLGVGGLIKAYRQGAAMAIEASTKRLIIPTLTLTYEVPYELWGDVLAILDKEQLSFEADHSSKGAKVYLEIKEERAPEIRSLFDALSLKES